MTIKGASKAPASTLTLALALSSLGALPLAATSCGVRATILDDEQASSVSPIAAWMQAVCNVRRACCGPDPDALYALAGCEADLDTRYGFQAAYSEGRVTTNSAILAPCVTAAKDVTSCAAADPDLAACRGALVGTVVEGGTCRSSYECARGAGGVSAICVKTQISHGDYDTPSETGVCHPSPLGKQGDACTLTVGTSLAAAEWTVGDMATAMSSTPVVRCSLEQGLACDGVCAPSGRVGDPCQFSDGCAHGLVCGCGMCQNDPLLAASRIVPCVDGACQPMCPAPTPAPGREYCVDRVDPSDGLCRVDQVGCAYSRDCPASWALAQSPTGCSGTDPVVVGECGDTFTWHREFFHLTCHYDKKSGNLVGLRQQTENPNEFCYGSSPGHLERLAGHVPATCPPPSAGTTISCSPGCDGGA